MPAADEAPVQPPKQPWYKPFATMIAILLFIYCCIATYGSCKGEGTRREVERAKLLTEQLGSVENFLRYEEARNERR